MIRIIFSDEAIKCAEALVIRTLLNYFFVLVWFDLKNTGD